MQAINDLHEDEDFQQDAGQSHILGVVDEIRSNSAAMAKYEKNATVMHVLQKLRRFQVHIFVPNLAGLPSCMGGQLCCGSVSANDCVKDPCAVNSLTVQSGAFALCEQSFMYHLH